MLGGLVNLLRLHTNTWCNFLLHFSQLTAVMTAELLDVAADVDYSHSWKHCFNHVIAFVLFFFQPQKKGNTQFTTKLCECLCCSCFVDGPSLYCDSNWGFPTVGNYKIYTDWPETQKKACLCLTAEERETIINLLLMIWVHFGYKGLTLRVTSCKIWLPFLHYDNSELSFAVRRSIKQHSISSPAPSSGCQMKTWDVRHSQFETWCL